MYPSCLLAKVGLHPGHVASLLQGHIERQTTIRTLIGLCLPHMHDVFGLCEEAGGAATWLITAPPCLPLLFSTSPFNASCVSCSLGGICSSWGSCHCDGVLGFRWVVVWGAVSQDCHHSPVRHHRPEPFSGCVFARARWPHFHCL